jgi:hypothetical protein
MVICGSYIFTFSVKRHDKGGDSKEGSDTFMFNTNYQEIENSCRAR